MFQTAEEMIVDICARTHHKVDLTRLQKVLELYGNPHLRYRTIHIAGTNGKGSTTNYTRSMLQAAGYRVGTFTSPHLETHLDRIRINDRNIDAAYFLSCGQRYDDMWRAQGLNMFEIDFFISALYFQEMQVDFAIYEVGMGGRLDSTNVIAPLYCAITNIGMDHMQFLGDTREKIAAEKAGIIKAQVPLFTTERNPVCLRVMRNKCKEVGSMMHIVPEAHIAKKHPLYIDWGNYSCLELGNVALYQRNNAVLALALIEEMQKDGHLHIRETAIRSGLKTIWKGRFEIIKENPTVIIDGAHNEEGITALCESLHSYAQPKKIIVSILKDKPYTEMLTLLREVSDDVTLTQFDYPRALQVYEAEGIDIQRCDDWREVLTDALDQRKKMVVITGSLYFISEVRAFLVNLSG